MTGSIDKNTFFCLGLYQLKTNKGRSYFTRGTANLENCIILRIFISIKQLKKIENNKIRSNIKILFIPVQKNYSVELRKEGPSNKSH